MSDQTRRCFYDGCPHPVTDRSNCIFHEQNLQTDQEDTYRIKFTELIHTWIAEGKETWNFEGFWFPPGIDLSNFEYPKEVSFRRARFRGRVLFKEKTLHAVDWSQCEFSHGVRFERTSFAGISKWLELKCGNGPLEFSGCSFAEDFDLVGGSLDGLIVRGNSEFKGSVGFDGTQFMGDVSLDLVNFSGYFSLSRCSVYGLFFAVGVRFGGVVRLDESTFLRGLFFHGSQLGELLSCEKAHFKERFELSCFTLPSSLEMSYARFSSVGLIHSCNIVKNVKLHWPGVGNAPTDAQGHPVERGTLIIENPDFGADTYLDISDNRSPSDSKFVLKSCDMSHILLRGSEVACVEFTDCQNWPSRGGRLVVADENILERSSDAEDLWKLAATYQGLVKNLGDRDFRLANDFQAGVFESRRLAARKLLPKRGWNEFFWMSLYRLGSNYSTNMSRPLWLLGAMVVTFAFAYWRTSWLPEVDPLWPNAFNVSLQVSTLFGAGKEIVRDNSFVYNLLVVVQAILTFACVSLFLLALRKTFRHK